MTTSGNLLAHNLAHAGHQCVRRDIVRDDIYQIRRVIGDWIADPDVQIILTTGGTGFSHRDHTPAAILPLLDREIPGFGELFRQISYTEIGSSTIQSRAFAGSANQTLIFCLRIEQRLRNRLGADPARAVRQQPPPVQLRLALQAH